MREWLLDYDGPLPEELPADYAKVDTGTLRVRRGGGWSDVNLAFLETDNRQQPRESNFRKHDMGIRCARDLPPEPPR